MKESFILCSSCFSNQGLKISAQKLGIKNDMRCTNCEDTKGYKLTKSILEDLAHQFFVMGSGVKGDYGGAPRIKFNEYQETSIVCTDDINQDIRLFEKYLKVGFFHYGARLWTLGYITPLEDLQDKDKRMEVIKRIISEYPILELDTSKIFYRLRVAPSEPSNIGEYDSSPFPGKGRLDSEGFKIFYASQDLEVCIHECRVSVTDELYVATIRPLKNLKMLDLSTEILENVTEFESLNISLIMLFYAGKHSYEILRLLSLEAYKKGFDGIIFPSFFTQARLGALPSPSTYQSLNNNIDDFREIEESGKIPNIAIFGQPIEDKLVEVLSINKLFLNRVVYDYFFGPADVN